MTFKLTSTLTHGIGIGLGLRSQDCIVLVVCEKKHMMGRLNARVMETAGNAFYGVWNAHVMEAACKLSCTETAGNGNGM